MQLSIVGYLDEAATIKIKELQYELSYVTGSKAALSSWLSHVTFGDGVLVAEDTLSQLEADLQQLA